MKKENNSRKIKLDPKFAYSEEEIRRIDHEIEREKKQAELDKKSEELEIIETADKKKDDDSRAKCRMKHYKKRRIVVIGTLVFLVIVAANIGCAMALLELNKTPRDFIDLFRPKKVMAYESDGMYDYAQLMAELEAEESLISDDEDSLSSDSSVTDSDINESKEVSRPDNSEISDLDDESGDGNSSLTKQKNDMSQGMESGGEDEYVNRIVIDDESEGNEEPDNFITEQSLMTDEAKEVVDESPDEAVADEAGNEYLMDDTFDLYDPFGNGNVRAADASDDALGGESVRESIAGADINALYPLPFTTVDESYFNDALFIGDSRFLGFAMWSGLPATNYCVTSFSIFNIDTMNVVQTENGKVPIFTAMPYDAFTKIYIKVGLNEMGGSEAAFEQKYAEVIERLRLMQPRAVIYVNAILPVTAAKSASDKTHNNKNISLRNAALKQFAIDQKAYFIDAGPYVSGEDGALKPEMTSDGIHMGAKYMGLWKQCLLEHAVPVS